MARFNVNYVQLQGGTPSYAFRQITGMPSTSFNTRYELKTADAVWNLVSKWDKRKFIMGADCDRGWGGLEHGHAYSLLGAYTLNGHRVYKMRNPWHSEIYKGPWSDNDYRWTPELRRQVGAKVANDGIFFFPAEHFLDAFAALDVAFYNEEW